MSKEELIKKYNQEKFKIEMDINRENDSLLKYQLDNDAEAIKDCNLRLENLHSNLRDIENAIDNLKNGSDNSLDLPIPTKNDLSITDVPIDNGTATIGLTVTNEVNGTTGIGKDKTNIHSKETRQIKKTYQIADGEIIRESITEKTDSHTEKTKNDAIDIKSKVD